MPTNINNYWHYIKKNPEHARYLNIKTYIYNPVGIINKANKTNKTSFK